MQAVVKRMCNLTAQNVCQSGDVALEIARFVSIVDSEARNAERLVDLTDRCECLLQ